MLMSDKCTAYLRQWFNYGKILTLVLYVVVSGRVPSTTSDANWITILNHQWLVWYQTYQSKYVENASIEKSIAATHITKFNSFICVTFVFIYFFFFFCLISFEILIFPLQSFIFVLLLIVITLHSNSARKINSIRAYFGWLSFFHCSPFMFFYSISIGIEWIGLTVRVCIDSTRQRFFPCSFFVWIFSFYFFFRPQICWFSDLVLFQNWVE